MKRRPIRFFFAAPIIMLTIPLELTWVGIRTMWREGLRHVCSRVAGKARSQCRTIRYFAMFHLRGVDLWRKDEDARVRRFFGSLPPRNTPEVQ